MREIGPFTAKTRLFSPSEVWQARPFERGRARHEAPILCGLRHLEVGLVRLDGRSDVGRVRFVVPMRKGSRLGECKRNDKRCYVDRIDNVAG